MAFLDAFAIIGSFLFAYYLRFHLEFLAISRVPVTDVSVYVRGALLLSVIWGFLLWHRGAYFTGPLRDMLAMGTLRQVVVSGIQAICILMVISFLYRGLLLSRQVYLMTVPMAIGAMICVRLLLRAIEEEVASKGLCFNRMLVVGISDTANAFCQKIRQTRAPVHFVGFVEWQPGSEDRPSQPPLLGSVSQLPEIYQASPFDSILISFPTTQLEEELIKVLNFCEEKGIAIYNVPHHVTIALKEEEMGVFCGMPLLRIQDAAGHFLYAFVKRCIDLGIAGTTLVLGLPLWIAIAIAIKFGDGGPIFFRQKRIGLHGEPFTIYKFRSMWCDAEARLHNYIDVDKLAVPGFKIENDPRVTRVGKWLRRTSLDEMPQILNVLRGEMSIVGPRPEMPMLVDRYSPAQRRRLKARPGLTGYMQIHRRGAPLASPESIHLDLLYLKNQSLFFDLMIILKTFQVVLTGKGVTH